MSGRPGRWDVDIVGHLLARIPEGWPRVVAILVSSLRPPSLALFALRETVAIAVGTVVAALIPAARRRQSFAYGLLLPVAVALVSLLARGPTVEPPR